MNELLRQLLKEQEYIDGKVPGTYFFKRYNPPKPAKGKRQLIKPTCCVVKCNSYDDWRNTH